MREAMCDMSRCLSQYTKTGPFLTARASLYSRLVILSSSPFMFALRLEVEVGVIIYNSISIENHQPLVLEKQSKKKR